jgi:hypothetical protein
MKLKLTESRTTKARRSRVRVFSRGTVVDTVELESYQIRAMQGKEKERNAYLGRREQN